MQLITATRMGQSAMRNLTTMKKMVGVQSFPNLTLVASMWDIVDPAKGENREKELVENSWQDLSRMEQLWVDSAAIDHLLSESSTQSRSEETCI
jgi:hypothetical protein